jgi:hypothetical protein
MTPLRFGFIGLALTAFALSVPAQTTSTGTLKLVPPDAAVFGHLDVAKILASKVGEAVRNLEVPNDDANDPFDKKPEVNPPKTIKPIPEFVKKFKDATGIDLESIKTATFFVPKFKGPGDEQTFVLAVTLPAYDQAKLLTGLGKLNEEFKEVKQKEPGIVEFNRAGFRLGFPNDTTIYILGGQVKAMPTEQTGKGVVAPALEAAASGKAFTLSLNFANFPEEIKGDDLPAEARPFAPLLKSELSFATFDIEGDTVAASVRIRSENRPRSIEAEKALGALITFARTGLAVAQAQLESEKEKNKSLEPLVGLVASLQTAVKTAKFASDDTEARVDLKMKADTPFAAAVLAVFQTTRGAAARSQTANNLKQIGLAMHNYHDAMGYLPMPAICDKNGKPLLSWRVAILPYIEQDALYRQFKLDEPWDSEHNKKLAENYRIKVYTIPGVDDLKEGKTRFRVFMGGKDKVSAMFEMNVKSKLTEITDGTSNTLMVVAAKEAVLWTKPDELIFDPKGNPADLLYFQNDVTPALFGDGSVRYLSRKVTLENWRALVSKNGGEVVSNP